MPFKEEWMTEKVCIEGVIETTERVMASVKWEMVDKRRQKTNYVVQNIIYLVYLNASLVENVEYKNIEMFWEIYIYTYIHWLLFKSFTR